MKWNAGHDRQRELFSDDAEPCEPARADGGDEYLDVGGHRVEEQPPAGSPTYVCVDCAGHADDLGAFRADECDGGDPVGQTIRVCHKPGQVVEKVGDCYRVQIELGGVTQQILVSPEYVEEQLGDEREDTPTDANRAAALERRRRENQGVETRRSR